MSKSDKYFPQVPTFGFGVYEGLCPIQLDSSVSHSHTSEREQHHKINNDDDIPTLLLDSSAGSSESGYGTSDPFRCIEEIEAFIGDSEKTGVKKECLIDVDLDLNIPTLKCKLDNGPTIESSIQLEKCEFDFSDSDKLENNMKNTDGRNVSSKMKTDTRDYDPFKLPSRSIVYDYTTQPLRIVERKRIFLPHVMAISLPLLRPIFIDGISLIDAFFNCCPDALLLPNESQFPIIPMVRCLFYWISKGHKTLICFSKDFNPFSTGDFNISDDDTKILQKLEKYKMIELFSSSDSNINWYSNKMKDMRACLIATAARWHQHLPSSLKLENNGYTPRRDERPDRLLQPFFGHSGNLVFFSSYSAKGLCVADIILDDNIYEQEEFIRHDKNQLTFVEQAKMLKCLYDILPAQNRFREACIMVEIIKRLKNFL